MRDHDSAWARPECLLSWSWMSLLKVTVLLAVGQHIYIGEPLLPVGLEVLHTIFQTTLTCLGIIIDTVHSLLLTLLYLLAGSLTVFALLATCLTSDDTRQRTKGLLPLIGTATRSPLFHQIRRRIQPRSVLQWAYDVARTKDMTEPETTEIDDHTLVT